MEKGTISMASHVFHLQGWIAGQHDSWQLWWAGIASHPSSGSACGSRQPGTCDASPAFLTCLLTAGIRSMHKQCIGSMTLSGDIHLQESLVWSDSYSLRLVVGCSGSDGHGRLQPASEWERQGCPAECSQHQPRVPEEP
jgi:hypothetical protein